MYIPLLISVLYVYLSVRLSNVEFMATDNDIVKVFRNLLITEILFWLGDEYVLRYSDSFSVFNFIIFFVAQDIYFYFIHYLFHRLFYKYHADHHSLYAPFYAWYGSIYEHVLLNLLSIAIPFILFPNTQLVFVIIIVMQTYTSVNGHTDNSRHNKHHLDPKKRLGSIYLVDRLLGTY